MEEITKEFITNAGAFAIIAGGWALLWRVWPMLIRYFFGVDVKMSDDSEPSQDDEAID